MERRDTPHTPREPKRTHWALNTTDVYTDEERTWLKAVDQRRRELGHQLSACEFLALAKSLGYRKEVEGGEDDRPRTIGPS